MVKFVKTHLGALMLLLLSVMAAVSSAVMISTWDQKMGRLILGADKLLELLQAGQMSLPQVAKAMTLIPTMTVAILAGGLLAAASTLLQTVAQNPLASDSTLAVGSGAQMALLLTTLFFPSLGLYGSFWVSFVGACLGVGAVFLLALPSRLNPVVLVLSGLVVNMLLSAVASVLLLYHSELTLGVMVWGSGILTQTGWHTSVLLVVTAAMFVGALFPVYRSLVVMALPDAQAKSLGVSVANIRRYVVLLVCATVALVVSKLGIIGFVGLCGATLAGQLTIRSLAWRLLMSFLFGGLILWVVSNVMTLYAPNTFVGAGAMTAFLGVPLVIYLLLTLPKQKDTHMTLPFDTQRQISPCYLLMALVVLMLMALCFAPYVVGSGQQLQMAFGLNADWALIGEFRLPRTLTAISAGMMLATAGVILQNLTHNPMASPEVLGIGSATAMGVVVGFLLLPVWGLQVRPLYLFGFGAVFALLTLGLILTLVKRIASTHLLLVGVAISALMAAALSVIKVSNDPRLFTVLSFLSGSTYYATPQTAGIYFFIAVLGVAVAYGYARPLALLSFGLEIAQGRGLLVTKTRLVLFTLVALLSAVATFAVGFLSFVGLLAPHLAYMLGARTLGVRIVVSVLLGAMILMVSDWFGRYMIFPYEIPVGTLASLFGGAYFMLLMRRLK